MENQCVFCEVCTIFYILISWTSLTYWFSAVSITLTFTCVAVTRGTNERCLGNF